jgi:hypothetical protein
MKNRLLLSMLALALLGVAGCASMQPPAAPAAAAPHFSTPPPEVRATILFTGLLLQVYYPETRTLYVWTGNPKPKAPQPMNCFKLQLSDTPSGAPQRLPCEQAAAGA